MKVTVGVAMIISLTVGLDVYLGYYGYAAGLFTLSILLSLARLRD